MTSQLPRDHENRTYHEAQDRASDWLFNDAGIGYMRHFQLIQGEDFKHRTSSASMFLLR